jgi:hypothetical protein
MKLQLPDGRPQILCNSTDPRGGTWNQDGILLFAPYPDKGLYTVSSAGGNPSPATQLVHGEASHRFPIFLPNGRDYLFYVFESTPNADGIYLGSLGSNEKKKVLADSASGSIFIQPDLLLYQKNFTLFTQAFDLKEKRVTGDPVPIIDQLTQDAQIGGTSGFSSTTSAIACARGSLDSRFVWYDRAGREVGSVGTATWYDSLALSPDGKGIAATASPFAPTASNDLWVLDPFSGNRSRLTFTPGSEFQPIWSPDGMKILFSNVVTGPFNIYVKDATGSGEEQLLVKSENWVFADDWSLDGRFVLYEETNPKTNYDLWVMPMFGDRTPFVLLNSPSLENHGVFSPNGKYFAYSSDVTGRAEVCVQTFPDVTRGKWQISTGGGTWPVWSKGSKELFYVTLDRKMMAVDITGGFQAVTSKVLFPNFPRRVNPTDTIQYAASRDA